LLKYKRKKRGSLRPNSRKCRRKKRKHIRRAGDPGLQFVRGKKKKSRGFARGIIKSREKKKKKKREARTSPAPAEGKLRWKRTERKGTGRIDKEEWVL